MAANASAPPDTGDSREPRVLMIGKGWFPAEFGGLDRYYRGLLTTMRIAEGVVIGPADDAPARVAVVGHRDSPLPRRVLAVALAAARRMGDADLVDIHFALYGLLPSLLSGLYRKPLVVHFHGPWADESVAAGEAADWKITAKRRLERAVYRRADASITLTSAFKEVLVSRYGVAPERIEIVRPGVDTDEFQPGDRTQARSALEVPEGAFVVCCARRLVLRMGIDVLLDAWSRSLADDADAYLIIVGGGPLQAALTQRAEDLKLGARVRITGPVSDAMLRAVYVGADLNVVPSRTFEGFGLTVLEAAACGTPSVVTDAGGLPEAVSGLADDLVVSAGSVDALAQRLLGARRGRLPTRRQTREWSLRQGWTAAAARHRQLYAELTSTRRRTRKREGDGPDLISRGDHG